MKYEEMINGISVLSEKIHNLSVRYLKEILSSEIERCEQLMELTSDTTIQNDFDLVQFENIINSAKALINQCDSVESISSKIDFMRQINIGNNR